MDLDCVYEHGMCTEMMMKKKKIEKEKFNLAEQKKRKFNFAAKYRLVHWR